MYYSVKSRLLTMLTLKRYGTWYFCLKKTIHRDCYVITCNSLFKNHTTVIQISFGWNQNIGPQHLSQFLTIKKLGFNSLKNIPLPRVS